MRFDNLKATIMAAMRVAGILPFAAALALGQQQINLTAAPATVTLPDSDKPLWIPRAVAPTAIVRPAPLVDRQAIQRMGEFRDVANVVDFFLRPESDFVTGQALFLGSVLHNATIARAAAIGDRVLDTLLPQLEPGASEKEIASAVKSLWRTANFPTNTVCASLRSAGTAPRWPP